jgi:hypothetical protein
VVQTGRSKEHGFGSQRGRCSITPILRPVNQTISSVKTVWQKRGIEATNGMTTTATITKIIYVRKCKYYRHCYCVNTPSLAIQGGFSRSFALSVTGWVFHSGSKISDIFLSTVYLRPQIEYVPSSSCLLVEVTNSRGD